MKLDSREGVVSMKCSAGEGFIDAVLDRYPTADFIARPTNACTVRFDDGRTLDILRIRGEWYAVKLTSVDD